ncbi:hypothetical protein RF11_08329 [Thelohanellus kitauei]|uniref:HTH La-type RNA-binding domain-containing protein n=1 Tax=Thelohanellus kitauei TaxID=669202 RepID=A0A0C2N976_THEKT|nr:hypothetical protein RF11_08329 [Thelohanellus kitauei]
MKEDNGCMKFRHVGVSLDCLLTFKRLREMTTSADEVIKACKESTLFEIDETNKKIRVSEEKITDKNLKDYMRENVDRLYQIDFLSNDCAMDQIENLFETINVKTEFIRMVRNGCKGSCRSWCVLVHPGMRDDLIESLQNLSIQNNEFTVKKLSDLPDSEHLECKMVGKKHKQTKREKKAASCQAQSLLIIKDVPTEITFKQLRDAFRPYRTPEWMNRSGSDVIIIFRDQDAAKEVMEKLVESLGIVKINDFELKPQFMSAEEQASYLSAIYKTKEQSEQKKKNQMMEFPCYMWNSFEI